MFKSIALRRQNPYSVDKPLDLGFLFECLLFYQTVEVIADHKILQQLIGTLGPGALEELLSSGNLKLLYQEERPAIFTKTKESQRQFHGFVVISSPTHALQEEARRQCVKSLGKEGKGRRAAQRLERFISPFKHDVNFHSSVETLFADNDFIRNAAELIIRKWVPELPQDFPVLFNCIKEEDGVSVATNLDFRVLNSHFHKRIHPSIASITPALILALISDSEEHIMFASRQLAELAVDPLGHELVAHRFGHLAKRRTKSEESRQSFSEVVLGSAKALRESFNSGSVPVDDVVRVILASSRFKAWIAKQDMDADLVHSYYSEITAGTFIDRLPGKASRFAFFTGAGLALDATIAGGLGTAAGIALGAADSFLLDRVLRGWKPSQFVEDHLIPLAKRHNAPRS